MANNETVQWPHPMTQLLSESYQREILTFMETTPDPGGIYFVILMMSCPEVYSHL